ncbi:MAG: hypothetical protein ACYCRH_05415 [Acidiferrobacteraceae bacterium]
MTTRPPLPVRHTGTLETGRLDVWMRIHLTHDGLAVGMAREHALLLQASARTLPSSDAFFD